MFLLILLLVLFIFLLFTNRRNVTQKSQERFRLLSFRWAFVSTSFWRSFQLDNNPSSNKSPSMPSLRDHMFMLHTTSILSQLFVCKSFLVLLHYSAVYVLSCLSALHITILKLITPNPWLQALATRHIQFILSCPPESPHVTPPQTTTSNSSTIHHI